MNRPKGKQNSDWKDGFLFVGNHLALDFLNTRPVQNGDPLELLPDFTALLRWFRAADLLSSRGARNLQQDWRKSARASLAVKAIQELREILRKDVLEWEGGGWVRQSTLDELNRLMAGHPMLTRLSARGKSLATQLYFAPRRPEDLFAPLAYGASELLANVDRRRVRKCDRCVLHFQDVSKKGTRRWCSMQLCGNRLKVAAYAARQRARRRQRDRRS
jgi:predicted RNA-binding Zn ribbon-like protein